MTARHGTGGAALAVAPHKLLPALLLVLLLLVAPTTAWQQPRFVVEGLTLRGADILTHASSTPAEPAATSAAQRDTQWAAQIATEHAQHLAEAAEAGANEPLAPLQPAPATGCSGFNVGTESGGSNVVSDGSAKVLATPSGVGVGVASRVTGSTNQQHCSAFCTGVRL